MDDILIYSISRDFGLITFSVPITVREVSPNSYTSSIGEKTFHTLTTIYNSPEELAAAATNSFLSIFILYQTVLEENVDDSVIREAFPDVADLMDYIQDKYVFTPA